MRLYGHAHEVFRFSSPSLKKGVGRSSKKGEKGGTVLLNHERERNLRNFYGSLF